MFFVIWPGQWRRLSVSLLVPRRLHNDGRFDGRRPRDVDDNCVRSGRQRVQQRDPAVTDRQTGAARGHPEDVVRRQRDVKQVRFCRDHGDAPAIDGDRRCGLYVG